ncbi:MAG: ABC transporter permease [Acidobacteriota bacterium]|jgi:putative ABC transport system permease protein
MLAYQMRLAWLSLRRNPFLSLITMLGIALGIFVSMTFVTAYYRLSGNPIPQKSDRLFYVQMDAWDPQRAWDDDDPSEPPVQLTYLDAMGITESDVPTYRAAMYKAYLTVIPEQEDQRPFRQNVRMTFGDFFPMFDVPFRYGSGWSREADEGPEAVVVLGDDINQRLFGGEDSTGRIVRIEDREFKVIGVLQPWRPMPKFYDTHNNEFGEAEEIFMPFRWGRDMEIYSSGNTSGWKSYSGNEYEDFLQSENTWIQYWVQLDDASQKEAYLAYLNAYAGEQKKLGRFGRPINNKLRSVMEWLHYERVIPEEATTMLIISILFLVVCSVNLIGILLGKFLARAPEVGVRRALGASRRWVFVQHLLECEVIGVVGCVLGVGASIFGLEIIDRLFGQQFNFQIDLNMLAVALSLALASALLAGAYPAWRICRIQPGAYLKSQ